MVKEIIEIKSTVKDLLENYPSLRNSDNRLIANIWNMQLSVHPFKNDDVLKCFAQGLLASPESIRRSRQLIQANNPDLRGTNYKGRMEEETNVRNNINKI